MADTGSDGTARPGFDLGPHAFDPRRQPECFRGVAERRVIAFLIDLVVITVPVAFASMFIFLFGIVTLGLGFVLFALVPAATAIWALFYYGLTMGGPWSATVGMRAVDLEVRTTSGAPCHFLLGAIHGLLFWLTVTTLSPLVVVVGLLNDRRRLLHDFVLGTVVVNAPHRAALLRARREW